ncbi:uncharacterized protein LOC129611848 isoform X2 [Condylostylus longicornis]|nr:uncharacterized protein LOC129611848 isoform X2 [Condylostylus longicornis]
MYTKVRQRENLPDSIQYINDYKLREEQFLEKLKETIVKDCKILTKKKNELTPIKVATKSDLGNENSSILSTSNDCDSVNNIIANLSTHNIVDRPAASEATMDKTKKPLMSDRNQQTSSITPPFPICQMFEQQIPQNSENEELKEECEKFIKPLLNRASSTISAALAAYDAFEQLSSLHGLIDKILKLEEQNYLMAKYIRDVKMLSELKAMQTKNYSNDLLDESEDLYAKELNLTNNGGLLNTILAAGNTASSKRNFAKRHNRERSKSVFCDEIPKQHAEVTSTPRRQSAYATNSNKVKVSKWTKVKAAFKWEKANVQSLEELSKANSNQLKPINNEVARYLRVPAPIPISGSSVDSILSTSAPPTPANVSSASSLEDVRQLSDERRDSSKSDSRFETQLNNVEEESRRSRSLDSDMMISQMSTSVVKSKTPWTKVKNMIQTHSASFKTTRSRSIKSSNSAGKDSRDVSPSEFNIDSLQFLLNESPTQKQNCENILSPSSSSTTANSQKCNSSGPNSPVIISGLGLNDSVGGYEQSNEIKSKMLSNKSLRRNKNISGFESLPEGATIDIKLSNQPKPNPLILNSKMLANEVEFSDICYFPIIGQKISSTSSNRKHLMSVGNSSVPSSPSRHSEFFPEFESEDMSSGDFSEPTTPSRKLSDRLYYQLQRDEINERYLELKEKLNKEFEAKRQEWEKIRFSCSSSSSSAYQLLQSNDLLQTNKNIPPKFLEENLSADFKKKLHKWRNKKPETTSLVTRDNFTSPLKGEKIDWNLWKTGQLKLEGQGLSPLPDQKSLPEEFQKKLDQWKKIKDASTNSNSHIDTQSSLRRSSGKFGIGKTHETPKKSKDDAKFDKEKFRLDKEKFNKSYEKEKSEKLLKLRAIVTEPRAKEIEVQTSVGVMKFEGISRKFTRKLYEWEKAKGIGPESSTFAFLYPGYRSVISGKKSAERRSNEPSPNLGRSLSLDSISPIQSVPSASHQTSCLSLNDADEFRIDASLPEQTRRISSDIELCENNSFEKNMEDLRNPLGLSCIEPCLFSTPKDFLISAEQNKKIGAHNLTLNKFEEAIEALKLIENKSLDNLQNALRILNELENSIPDFEDALGRLNSEGKEAMARVRKHVTELKNQCHQLDQDEACCQELLDERMDAIAEILYNLKQNIILVSNCAQMISSELFIPKINITSEDGCKMVDSRSSNTPLKNISKYEKYNETDINEKECATQIPTQNIEFVNVSAKTAIEPTFDSKNKICRNSSNGSRKKSRLRKMGSRQNSKTESESTDDEAVNSNEVAQRRLKRRLSRNKKSIEEDKFELDINENITTNNIIQSNKYFPTPGGEDVVYVLKIKPGQPIEQSEVFCNYDGESSKILISPTETSVQLLNSKSQENVELEQQNIFVKTKRKIFTLVGRQASETGSDSGIGPLAVSRDLDSSTTTEVPETEDSCRDSISLNSFSKPYRKKLEPPISIKKDLNSSEKSTFALHSSKEPGLSVKAMIDDCNQKLETKAISKSPLSSGTCTPSSIRSPLLERKLTKSQTDIFNPSTENITKSASFGSIVYKQVIKEEISSQLEDRVCRISKSFSLENIAKKICNEMHSPNIEPLAYDSLKNIKKGSEAINNPKLEMKSKEHLFKKNKEKPINLNVTKGGALRKIDLKQKLEQITRRNSSTSESGDIVIESFNSFNKSDNTIPKITRKLENKATTPTEKSHPLCAELWHPLLPISNKNYFDQIECPTTPINERAVKLALAKERFLKEIPKRTASFKESFDTENVNPRFSQTSFESEFSNEAWKNYNDVSMTKAVSNSSLEVIKNDNNCNPLPRSIVRSEKFASKLGFATLASKFRKKKRENEVETISKMSTVSVLCQQSLMLDVAQVNKGFKTRKEATDSLKNTGKNYNVIKSKSSHVGSFGTLFKSKDKNKGQKNDQKDNGNNKDNILKSKSAILFPLSNDK